MLPGERYQKLKNKDVEAEILGFEDGVVTYLRRDPGYNPEMCVLPISIFDKLYDKAQPEDFIDLEDE